MQHWFRSTVMRLGGSLQLEQNTNWRYSLSSRYLCGNGEEVDWSAAVWTSRSIPRQSFHVWMVVQNRLPTRDRMIHWGLAVPPVCLLCNGADESRDHLYWECNVAYDLWKLIADRCGVLPQMRWVDSLNHMSSLPPPVPARSLTLLGWQAAIYWVWNERNKRLHANQFRTVGSLFAIVDHQIRNKIQSFRGENPKRSSEMMQLWFR